MYWRESCTDPTWESPACTKLFMNEDIDVPISQCKDGSWCQGNSSQPESQECCAAAKGLFIAPDGTATSVNPASNNQTSASAALSAPKDTRSSALVSPTGVNDGGNTGREKPLTATLPRAIIRNLGIGLGIGVPTVIGVIVFLTLRVIRNRRRQVLEGEKGRAYGAERQYNTSPLRQALYFGRTELPAESRGDLNRNYERLELPTNPDSDALHGRAELA